LTPPAPFAFLADSVGELEDIRASFKPSAEEACSKSGESYDGFGGLLPLLIRHFPGVLLEDMLDSTLPALTAN